MENKVRIGKDFVVRWAIVTSEGEPYAVNKEAAILRVYSPYGAKDAAGFKVAGNVIEWVFKGKDQKHLGDYTIELVENNGQDGMLSVDSVGAFTLVAHTNEESLNAEGAVEIQTIELTSQIALAPIVEKGAPPYDDTKIKQDIADLQEKDKATDAELATLSAEIGKKVDTDKVATINGQSLVNGGDITIEGGGEPSVYRVTYGETTFAEIKAEWEKGKHIICSVDGIDYLLSVVYDAQIFFAAVNGYTSYRVFVNSRNEWGKQSYQLEQTINKTTTLSASSTDTQYPSAKAAFMAISKKSEVSLEALANGNLKVTIDGVSKDFMPATPSGDPMHYAYVEAGAEYNDTGADIVRTGMYGDSIVWKSGYWYLNEIGDINNEEIRLMYKLWVKFPIPFSYSFGENIRTIFPFNGRSVLANCTNVLSNKNIEIVPSCYGENNMANNISSWFYEARNLRRCDILWDNVNNFSNAFVKCFKLERVNIRRLNKNISLADSSLLKNESILYMVANSNATSATTITLHADAYARAMADDEITAALAAHPNVSLASA